MQRFLARVRLSKFAKLKFALFLLRFSGWVSAVGIGYLVYYSVYSNYPWIITHVREDVAIAAAALAYFGWQYAISPSRDDDT